MDGEVNPGYLDVGAGDVLVDVVDVQLDYVTDDKTGQVRGGWLLLLRGVLKHLALLPCLFSSSRNSGVQDDWIMVVNRIRVSSSLTPRCENCSHMLPSTRNDNIENSPIRSSSKNMEPFTVCRLGNGRETREACTP